MAVSTFQNQQVFVKKESAFADTSYQSLAAGDAILARTLQLTAAHNRVPSREKRSTPDYVTDLPRMATASWSLSAAWQPSGTIGTESDLAPLFEALMGSKVASGSGSGVTTTVSASPTPTVNGCTVASATGMAVGDVIVVTTANGREATRITNIATAALTWSPPLTAAPATGAAVVDGVTYKQSTAAPPSLAVCNFMGSLEEAVIGAMVESATLTLAKSEEAVVSFNGPAAKYLGQGTASLTNPGSQTTVGSPINGLVAMCVVNGYSFKVTSLTVTPNNALAMRDQDLGAAYATEAFRGDRRTIQVQASFYVEDTRIMDLATALTKGGLSLVLGATNGSMVAVVAPSVLWEIASLPSGESGAAIMQATGTCYASSTGNDSLAIAEL